jgi:hypothetical protein
VSDTSDSETDDLLARGQENYQLNAEMLATILGAVQTGALLLSDENKATLQTATANGGTVNAVKINHRATHSIDLNIWSENKDLTSLIYDLVKQFIMGNLYALLQQGLTIHGSISGRRSGDINLEFGQLLYGANIVVPAVIDTATMVIDTPVGAINHIVPEPTYHETGES